MTPSAATSRARVFRKPVTPARAVFERISVGDRLAHRDRRDRDHPPPPLRLHRRAPPRCTSRSSARQFSSNAVAVRARVVVDAKLPGGGPPPLATRMSIPPSASRASPARSRARPPRCDTSATSGIASPPISRRGGLDPLARRGCRSRPCTPFVGQGARRCAKPSPCDAAATAARLAARSRGPSQCDPRSVARRSTWMGRRVAERRGRGRCAGR